MSQHIWTIQEALNWTIEYLDSKGIEHARRNAQYLLSHATGLSRIEVYAFFDRPLSEDERAILRETLKRRATGMPLQYAIGEAAFRYLTFKVTPVVLIPRPETEILVDLVKETLSQQDVTAPLIADIGTGSGCIALSCAYEIPDARVIATDVDEQALAIAKENAQAIACSAEDERAHALDERLTFCQGDYFLPVADYLEAKGERHLDALVSNPPYIPQAGMETLPSEVKDFEPERALFGGEDGLDAVRALVEQYCKFCSVGGSVGLIILELDERTLEAAQAFVKEHTDFTTVEIINDLPGKPRFLRAY